MDDIEYLYLSNIINCLKNILEATSLLWIILMAVALLSFSHCLFRGGNVIETAEF